MREVTIWSLPTATGRTFMPTARSSAAESITHMLATGTQPRVLVRTVSGLEQLAAVEMAAAGDRVIEVSTRQLIIEATSSKIITSPPRLADDLFLIGADLPDPGRTKADLASLAPALRAELAVPLPHEPGEAFAVSASFLGRRTYTRFDIEDLVGAALVERTGARYCSRRDGETPPRRRADWRVVLDGQRVRVAIRPFDEPLHRRDWRTQTVTGSLHPPVAAAIARLARIEPGHRVLDPFCGAGTILLEAHRIEPSASYTGIDRNPCAVAAARANSPGSGKITWRIGDANNLDSERFSVDRIITNPPWMVRLGLGDLAPYVDRWRQVLRFDGLVVAIVNHHQARTLIEDTHWQVFDVHDVSVAGQHPRFIVGQPTSRARRL